MDWLNYTDYVPNTFPDIFKLLDSRDYRSHNFYERYTGKSKKFKKNKRKGK